MLNRPLPQPARDALLLLARVLLGVVMFAHGYQKMILNGIGRTTDGFEQMDIPAAIVSASFVTVVEFAGSVLLLAGAATTLVCALMGVIMVGAGIFLANKGWELVGVIGVGLLFLMAAGPGRHSVDHLVRGWQARHRERLATATG